MNSNEAILVLVVLAAAIAAMVLQRAEANLHLVGGKYGWDIPDRNFSYSSWASTQNFSVGDILAFNFTAGHSSLARVTKEDYDACNTSNPLFITYFGPVNYTLNDTAENYDYYFTCNFKGHCLKGQKLAIKVIGPSLVATSPGLAPTSSRSIGTLASPPDQQGSTSTLAANSFALILVLIPIAIAFST